MILSCGKTNPTELIFADVKRHYYACSSLPSISTNMSFNFVLCLGFLFLSPFLINVEASKGRFRRSLMDMRSMVNTVVKGRKSPDFVGYGNWCGLGGSGKVLDPIDQCCQTHDMCYDLALKCRCKEEESIYRLPYSWKVAEDGTATCDDTCEGCEGALCMCDALLANCLRAHEGAYKSGLRHSMSIEELMQQARQI